MADRIVQEVMAGRFHMNNLRFVLRYAFERLTNVAVWGRLGLAV